MTDDISKIATPRGEGRSMQTLPPMQSAPGNGADWFGPSRPLSPVAPPEVAGRTYDFPQAANLATQPRAYEELNCAQLRALASAYDPVRIIIERRKDQLCRLSWSLRYRHDAKSKKLSDEQRHRLRDVTDFFRRPCAEHSFRTWLRVLLDDLLILDAPAIYLGRDPLGYLAELVPLDGATIKPIIDEHGRPPRPFLWDGSSFDWLGRKIATAADLQEIGAKVVGTTLFLPAYQQNSEGYAGGQLDDMGFAVRAEQPAQPFRLRLLAGAADRADRVDGVPSSGLADGVLQGGQYSRRRVRPA